MALPHHHGDLTDHHGNNTYSSESPWRMLLAEEERIWQKGGVPHLVSMTTDRVTMTTTGDGDLLNSYGGTVQYIHGYFTNFEPRRCCLLLAAGQSCPNAFKLVQHSVSATSDLSDPGSPTELPPVTSLSAKEFEVYHLSLLAAQFPVMSAPPPPPDHTPVSPPPVIKLPKSPTPTTNPCTPARTTAASPPYTPTSLHYTPTSLHYTPTSPSYTPMSGPTTPQLTDPHTANNPALPTIPCSPVQQLLNNSQSRNSPHTPGGATCRQDQSSTSSGLSTMTTIGPLGNRSCDQISLSIIPTETMSDILRQAFRLTRQIAAQLEKIVYKPYKKKSNAKILAEELVYQLSQIENNSHPYYTRNQFLNLSDYTCWQREQRLALTQKLNRFWHLSLPSLRATEERIICYHDNYQYLLRKLIRHEEKLKHGSLPEIPTLPLSGASQRILLEFSLRYGVGELFQRAVYLDYLRETYTDQLWYLRHTRDCVTGLGHMMSNVKVVVTQRELTLLKRCCVGLLQFCQKSISRCGQILHQQMSTQNIGVVVDLAYGLLTLKSLLTRGVTELTRGATSPCQSLEEILQQAVTTSVENRYTQEKLTAAKHLGQTDQTPSPKLLNCLMTFMRDEATTLNTQLGPVFIKYIYVGQVVSRSLYNMLMKDVKVMCSNLHVKQTSDEIDITILSLAYRLNQLDVEWGSFIKLSQQTWRHDYHVFIDHLMAALYSHMTALVLQAVANDKFLTVEIPKVTPGSEGQGQFDGDSYHHGYRSASVLSKLSTKSSGSLSHSSNSPFQPFIRGGVSSTENTSKSVHSTPLCQNKNSQNAVEGKHSISVSPIPFVSQHSDRTKDESRTFVVSSSVVDVSVIIQRLVRLQHLLSDSLYPCSWAKTESSKVEVPDNSTPRCDLEDSREFLTSETYRENKISDSRAASTSLTETGRHGNTLKNETLRYRRDKLVTSFSELVTHILDVYSVNMAAMDLCAVPLSTAKAQFGRQFISHMWEAKSTGQVWGCRHMAEQLPKCLPDKDPSQAKYLADCFTPADHKMCVRINNLIELSKVAPQFIQKMAAPAVSDSMRLPRTANNSLLCGVRSSELGQRSFKVISNDDIQDSAVINIQGNTQTGRQPFSETDTGFSEGEHLTSKLDSRSCSSQDSSYCSDSAVTATTQTVRVQVHHPDESADGKPNETEEYSKVSDALKPASSSVVPRPLQLDHKRLTASPQSADPVTVEGEHKGGTTIQPEQKSDTSCLTDHHRRRQQQQQHQHQQRDVPPVLSRLFTDTQTNLLSVSVGLTKLLTYRLQRYISTALALLLKLHPLSLDVTTNFSPLGSYLRTMIGSLRAWLSDENFHRVTRVLYSSMARDLERHTLELKSSPRSAETRARVLLRLIAYMLQEIKKMGSDGDLSYAVTCWEAPSLWLSMYSYPSWDLLCLFDTLQNMNQLAFATDSQMSYSLHCRLFSEVQQQKKCFTEAELLSWISENLSFSLQTISVLCPDLRDVSEPADVVRALLMSGLILALDSDQSQNRSAEMLNSQSVPIPLTGEPGSMTPDIIMLPGTNPCDHVDSQYEPARPGTSPSGPLDSQREPARPGTSPSGPLDSQREPTRPGSDVASTDKKYRQWNSLPSTRRPSFSTEVTQPRSHSTEGVMWFGANKPVGDTNSLWLSAPEEPKGDKKSPENSVQTQVLSDLESFKDLRKARIQKFYTLRDLTDWPNKLSSDQSHDTCHQRYDQNFDQSESHSDINLDNPQEGASVEVVPGDLIQLQYYLERRVTSDLVLSILVARSVREEKTRELLKKLPPELIKEHPSLSKRPKFPLSWLVPH